MRDKTDTEVGWTARVPELLVAAGALQLASFLGITIAFDGLAMILTPLNAVSLAVSLVLAGTVAGSGVWLGRSGVESAQYGRVPRWWFAGVAFFVLLNLPLIGFTPGLSPEGTVGWLHYAAATGSTAGALVGVSEARTVERARDAERAEVTAARAEEERRWLDYLNGLLRHEVLNNANVISGYAELGLEKSEGDLQDYFRTIRLQSEDMTQVIDDVQVLIEMSNEAASFEPVDLDAIVAQEVADLKATHPGVTVATSVPDGLYVEGDDLLRRVFGNLLSNAAEHNDDDELTVEVRAEAAPETVTVTVSDDGSGIPASIREQLFDRTGSGNHGLGLYLVDMLVDRYGGSVELAETGEDGTTFAVTLPRAEPPAEPAARNASPAADGAPTGYARNET